MSLVDAALEVYKRDFESRAQTLLHLYLGGKLLGLKHYGPEPHPSGSSQEVHGRRGEFIHATPATPGKPIDTWIESSGGFNEGTYFLRAEYAQDRQHFAAALEELVRDHFAEWIDTGEVPDEIQDVRLVVYEVDLSLVQIRPDPELTLSAVIAEDVVDISAITDKLVFKVSMDELFERVKISARREDPSQLKRYAKDNFVPATGDALRLAGDDEALFSLVKARKPAGRFLVAIAIISGKPRENRWARRPASKHYGPGPHRTGTPQSAHGRQLSFEGYLEGPEAAKPIFAPGISSGPIEKMIRPDDVEEWTRQYQEAQVVEDLLEAEKDRLYDLWVDADNEWRSTDADDPNYSAISDKFLKADAAYRKARTLYYRASDSLHMQKDFVENRLGFAIAFRGDDGRLEAFAIFDSSVEDVVSSGDEQWYMNFMATAPKNNSWIKDFAGRAGNVDKEAARRVGLAAAQMAVSADLDMTFSPATDDVRRLYKLLGAVQNPEYGKGSMVWSVEAIRAFIDRYGGKSFEPNDVFELPVIAVPKRSARRSESLPHNRGTRKHLGPGDHPSGSPQSVHGKREGGAASEIPIHLMSGKPEWLDRTKQIIAGLDSSGVSAVLIYESGKPLVLGGVSYEKAGEFFPETGEVVLYGRSFSLPLSEQRAVAAHEFSHAAFAPVRQAYFAERASVYADLQSSFDERGRLTSTAAERFKTYAALRPFLDSLQAWERLIISDGLTNYSRKHWTAAYANSRLRILAVDETLAEIASGVVAEEDIPKNWAGLFKAAMTDARRLAGK